MLSAQFVALYKPCKPKPKPEYAALSIGPTHLQIRTRERVAIKGSALNGADLMLVLSVAR